jgi:hypothetical protein
MPEFMNVTNTHVHVGEHRFVEPNKTVTLTESEAAPLVKGGWLVPILTQIGQEIIDSEISNFFNHLNNIPPTPIDITTTIPTTSDSKESTKSKKPSPKKSQATVKEDPPYIREALERHKLLKAQKLTDSVPGIMDQSDVFDSDKFE